MNFNDLQLKHETFMCATNFKNRIFHLLLISYKLNIITLIGVILLELSENNLEHKNFHDQQIPYNTTIFEFYKIRKVLSLNHNLIA